MNMETVEQFRGWIDQQIESLADSESFNETDWIHAARLIGQAREFAFQLKLPDAAIVARRGPVRQRLCEVLATLPAPDYLDIHEVANLLRVSVRTVRRGIITGEIPRPATINSVQRWHRSNFDG